MKNFIKQHCPQLFRLLVKVRELIFGFGRTSYAQFGEDLVLEAFIWGSQIKRGFYVDIGSYAPSKYSNTNFYYRRGWRGINIDAKPGSMQAFRRARPRDINLEVGITQTEQTLDFFIFQDSAYNTFSAQLAADYQTAGLPLVKKVLLPTRRLSSILEEYLPAGQKIDFMSIDVEGLDLEVLQSNNWEKYRPSYILAELHQVDIAHITESAIYSFLLGRGYKLVSVVNVTLIFKLVEKLVDANK
jgi:FkbM family methyltransferase